MRMFRFGRKLCLPATIPIKHQYRMLAARYEIEKAEAEGKVDVFHGQPIPAVSSVKSMTEMNAASFSGRIRAL
jgi:hypothetical protein